VYQSITRLPVMATDPIKLKRHIILVLRLNEEVIVLHLAEKKRVTMRADWRNVSVYVF
jgi:hypothetical protein